MQTEKITIPLNVNISLDAEDIKHILSILSSQSEALRLLEENRDTVEPILRAVFGSKP